MTAVIQDYTTAADVTDQTTLSINKPTGVVSGDLIVIVAISDPQGGSADPEWTTTQASTPQFDDSSNKPTGGTTFNLIAAYHEDLPANTDSCIAAWYKIAGGSEPSTYTVTGGVANEMNAWCFRIDGHDAASPIQGPGTVASSTFASSLGITGFTTTVDDVLCFAAHANDGSDLGPYTTSGTGWTEHSENDPDDSSAGCAGSLSTKTQASTGATGTCTHSWTGSDGCVGMQFGIAPASSGTTDVNYHGTGRGILRGIGRGIG